MLQDDGLHFNPDAQEGLQRNLDPEGLQRNLDSEGLQVVDTSHLTQPYHHSLPQKPEEIAEDKLPRRISPGRISARRIFGLRKRIIWLVCVISILVMAGALVGGLVGGYFLKKDRKNNNAASVIISTTAASTTTSTDPTTSTASSTSSAVTSGFTGMAENPCPAANQTTITSSGNLFVLYCGVDWPSGFEAASGNEIVQNLDAFIVYTLTSCIEECVSYNQQQNVTIPCKAVEYQANLTSALLSDDVEEGNCFLKSQVGKYSPASFGGMAAGMFGV